MPLRTTDTNTTGLQMHAVTEPDRHCSQYRCKEPVAVYVWRYHPEHARPGALLCRRHAELLLGEARVLTLGLG